MPNLARKRSALPTPDANDIASALAENWTEQTSSDPDRWSPGNRAWGQCAVSALIVQDYLGGDLLRGQMADGSHYWNLLPGGDEFDTTRSQFEDPPSFSEVAPRSREAVLAYPATQRRYHILSAAVRKTLASRARA